jgi:hypothetical protein
LGAGGRQFESGHPDKRKAFHEVRGFFVSQRQKPAFASGEIKKTLFAKQQNGFWALPPASVSGTYPAP